MRVLVLGASGMLGSALVSILSARAGWAVYGTLRSEQTQRILQDSSAAHLVTGLDIRDPDTLPRLFDDVRPTIVINCISLSKERLKAADPLELIPIYALLPHRLATLCRSSGARLVHISTDAVFSGARGGYTEDDPADANDLYGRAKRLGEVGGEQAITIRTSIIGHELLRSEGLLEWFLSQQGRCRCFRRVVFSGLPTVELARIIRDVVIPRPALCGVYHIAAKPISKYDLLRLVAEVYGKSIEIEPVDQPVLDRSLNAERFRAATGYRAPDWPELLETLHSTRMDNPVHRQSAADHRRSRFIRVSSRGA